MNDKKRTTIYIDPDLHEQIRRKAFEKNISMSELMRRAIQEYLQKDG